MTTPEPQKPEGRAAPTPQQQHYIADVMYLAVAGILVFAPGSYLFTLREQVIVMIALVLAPLLWGAARELVADVYRPDYSTYAKRATSYELFNLRIAGNPAWRPADRLAAMECLLGRTDTGPMSTAMLRLRLRNQFGSG